MATKARVQVLNQVVDSEKLLNENWVLCLQWCRYIYDDGTLEEGYRFIWRKPDGSLQAARGQARIPNLKIAQELINKAIAEGWGNNFGNSDKQDNK